MSKVLTSTQRHPPEKKMKASTQLQSSFQAKIAKIVLGALFVAGMIGMTSIARNPAPTPAIMVDGTAHTVIISAKCLSAEEKQSMTAQDASQNVQTVVLTAKRWSTSQKLASLHEEHQEKLLAARLLSLNSTAKVKEATQFS
ncbi:hypothetical protein [Undibacterium sp.]|uniref:hypothetical protein n=1 Tax=Undibacterium sp. TaxID=1914977 RepID=UPI002D7F9F26|nr:hypothetical protein [Undibacterium sp.]